ncbi:MAG: hypothetical protein EOO45_12185 [Flavobacterium sp.]|nr:MAG: hypothetical protein EOO45_12185 [Flavobacterium sp.]
MLSFTKELLRHSCIWNTSEEDSKNITGFPNSPFNVNEGFEVLHFVSRYMAAKGWASQSTFQNIESTIKTRLPFGVRSHRQVMEWLDLNFKR